LITTHDANIQYFNHRKTSAVPRVKTGDTILASKSTQASKIMHAKTVVNVAAAVTVVIAVVDMVIMSCSTLASHGVAVSAADVTATHVRAPVICHDLKGAWDRAVPICFDRRSLMSDSFDAIEALNGSWAGTGVVASLSDITFLTQLRALRAVPFSTPLSNRAPMLSCRWS